MKKINKKGIGHIEVIISFVIFISFIIFLLVVFNPLKIFLKASSSGLDITENKILKNISTELAVLSIKINPDGADCFDIQKPDTIGIDDSIIIKNQHNERINAYSNDKICFDNAGEFYRIYSAGELKENGLLSDFKDCKGILEEEYILGVHRIHNVISNSSLKELFQNYDENYEQLKQNLGLKNEFIVSVRDSSGIILEPQEKKYKPGEIDIMARDVPIEVLNSEGDLEPYILNIQAW